VNGRIVASEEEAVAALADIGSFDRARCRRDFDERFTVERMARDYLRVYRRLLDGAGVPATPTVRASA
jgi:glycosyltransferase involved in cell wall biosynthesis